MPLMLTLSSSVCPSTSKSPLASMAPVNVESPLTDKFLVVMSCPIEAPPVTASPPTKS